MTSRHFAPKTTPDGLEQGICGWCHHQVSDYIDPTEWVEALNLRLCLGCYYCFRHGAPQGEPCPTR
jgi:hypothetical protein